MVVQNQYIVNNTYYCLSSCIYLLLTKCVFRNAVQGVFQLKMHQNNVFFQIFYLFLISAHQKAYKKIV